MILVSSRRVATIFSQLGEKCAIQKGFYKRFTKFNAVIKRVSFSYRHNRCGIISYWFPFCTYSIYCIVSSFLELVPLIFSIRGVKCFLSNRLCQDPLEKYFGMQRQKGKSNENPSVIEFAKNSETLRLVGNMWFDDAKGNCRRSVGVKQSIEDTKHLPLRKRKRRASF